MQRCDYCGRILHKNVSGKYSLCSSKCKTKFKNKKYISELEHAVISVVKNGIMISEIVKILEYDKFDIVSAVSRLIYQKEKLYIRTKNEINLKVLIFIK